MLENPSVLDETSITTISPSPPRSAAGEPEDRLAAGTSAIAAASARSASTVSAIRVRRAAGASAPRIDAGDGEPRWSVGNVRRHAAALDHQALRSAVECRPYLLRKARERLGIGRVLPPGKRARSHLEATARGSRPGALRGRRAFAAERPRRRPLRPPRPAGASARAATGGARRRSRQVRGGPECRDDERCARQPEDRPR